MNLQKFLDDISSRNIPLHNFMIWQDGKVVAKGECPKTPLDQPHRMFSISKSLTAVAIGLLYSQGRIDLDDPIVKYFEDRVPENADKRILTTTIRHMLMMRTCHSMTTYKIDTGKDWTGSFFRVKPDHDPGTLWHYDTSSAHVLAALVEKLSGMSLLDFLRERLPVIHISGQAFFLTDETGVSQGGTGLVCLPDDILRLSLLFMDAHSLAPAQFIVKYGGFGFDAGLFQDYLLEASSFKSPTTMKAKSRFESWGYGYMIWQTDRGGFMMYGMGGQFAAIYPRERTILITTADTQNNPDGNDTIFDSFYENILNGSSDSIVTTSTTLTLPVMSGRTHKPLDGIYVLDENDHGFTELAVTVTADRGTITLKGNGVKYVLNFGIGKLISGIFSHYDMRCHGFGMWESEDMLYLRFYIIDSYVGSVHLQLHFSEDHKTVSVYMNKVEESLFNDFFMVHLRGSYE